jgi:hypothetical protein
MGSGGGGIECINYSSPLIENNVIIENEANFGGGIEAAYYSTPIIIDNVISENKADSTGGAFYTGFSSLTIQNNTIKNNTAKYGGAMEFVSGSPLVKGNIISGNSASDVCGGVRCYQCSGTVENNTISNNESPYGGGMQLYDAKPVITKNLFVGNASNCGGAVRSYESKPTITHNIFIGNTSSSWGGGIASYKSQITAVNNLFCSNSATRGGGIDLWTDSSVTLTNNTFFSNSADTGGALACSKDSTANIFDSILWNNQGNIGKEIYLGDQSNPSTVTIDYSDLEGNQASVYVEWSCALNWGSHMIDADPLFAAGYYGFFYLSQVLAGQLGDSPCVDTGSDLASNVGMDIYWTRTDEVYDSGTVDMGYHYGADFLFPSLQVDTFAIPENTGGSANFLLLAGAENANRNYLLLGSVSGTYPGIPLPGSKATLPLNWDKFTDMIVLYLNTAIFQDFMGTLDLGGSETAQMNLGPVPGVSPLTMYFAYALNKPWDFVSVPVAIDIVP